MDSSFRLFRVRGIDIGANWSWLFVFALMVWQLAVVIMPADYPGLAPTTYLVMATAAAVLFVISLLLHELGHAFRAQKEGMEIEGITLWFFGGVAKFKGNFPSAGAEFRIAIAGPLVTVVLSVLYGVIAFVLASADAPTFLRGVFDWLTVINVVLLVFNMIPALPLDGGRVLRSALWASKRNFTDATVTAARIARVFAGAMIALGLLSLVAPVRFATPVLALIGFFLLQAARAEEAYALFGQSLGAARVANLMTPNPDAVDPTMTVDAFVDRAYAAGHSTYPVVDPMGSLQGLMSIRQAAQVPFDERATTMVRDVMTPRDDVPVVDVGADIAHAITKLQGPPGRAVVLDMSRPVGILSASDVAKAVEFEQLRTPGAARIGAPVRRPRIGLWIFITVAALLAFSMLYSPPYVVIKPGTAFDVTRDITISGFPRDKVNGQYLLTSVAVEKPTLIGMLVAMAQDEDIVAEAALFPPDVDPEEYFKQQEALFREAQTIAAAAAAKAAGMKVDLTGKGAGVASVVPDGPAAKVLREGDVIIEVDGRPVRLADQVVSKIRSRPAGSEFTLRVRRAKREVTVNVRTKGGIVEGAPAIGALLKTEDFDVKLPFNVKFRKRDIGGPSAGLSYALAVYDMIDPKDIARGRIVATTGTMDLEGNVGEIGGIEDKAIAAKRKRAEVFLVPEAELKDVKESGLDVRGVRTLKDALEILGVKA